MDEQLRIILIIIVSVSIFGLLVFVFVKNYIRQKINNLVEEEKNKKTKVDLLFLDIHLFQYPLLFLMSQNRNRFLPIKIYPFYKIVFYYLQL